MQNKMIIKIRMKGLFMDCFYPISTRILLRDTTNLYPMIAYIMIK